MQTREEDNHHSDNFKSHWCWTHDSNTDDSQIHLYWFTSWTHEANRTFAGEGTRILYTKVAQVNNEDTRPERSH